MVLKSQPWASGWATLSRTGGLRPVTLQSCQLGLRPRALPEAQPLPRFISGLEVRSLRLREASTAGYTFTMPGGLPEGPGHIHIPAGEMQRLLGKGGF